MAFILVGYVAGEKGTRSPGTDVASFTCPELANDYIGRCTNPAGTAEFPFYGDSLLAGFKHAEVIEKEMLPRNPIHIPKTPRKEVLIEDVNDLIEALAVYKDEFGGSQIRDLLVVCADGTLLNMNDVAED